MSQLQFSWRNQRGFGLTLLFFGWAFLFQIPVFYHVFLIIQVPASNNDWLIFLGTIVAMTAILGSYLATIFENVFDPFDQTLFNAHSVVLISFLVFYLFYVISVPAILVIEPFLGLPTKIEIFGWGEYLISISAGIIAMTAVWYASELYSQRT